MIITNNRFFSSQRYVQNDSTILVVGGVGGGFAAAYPSLKTLTICHSERSEESIPDLPENADLTM